MSKAERRYWLLVFVWTTVLYATLPVARGLANKIEAAGFGKVLYIGPAVVIGLAFLVALVYIFRQPYSYRLLRALCMIIVASLYAFFLKYLGKIPIERIHLLEYGILAIFAQKAFENRIKDLFDSYLYAAFLVAIVGLYDELIQGFLPDRVCDARDVLTNGISGILGLMLWACISKKSAQKTVQTT